MNGGTQVELVTEKTETIILTKKRVAMVVEIQVAT